MENASKALLIAASLLIIILLVSFGMKIFNSSGDSSLAAQLTADAIASANTSARIDLTLNLIDIYDEKAFSSFIKSEYEGTQSTERVIELLQILMYRTKKVSNSNSLYKTELTHITSDGNVSLVYYDWRTPNIYNCEKLEKNKNYKVIFEFAYLPGCPYTYSIKIRE